LQDQVNNVFHLAPAGPGHETASGLRRDARATDYRVDITRDGAGL